jgi:hypothetical protein
MTPATRKIELMGLVGLEGLDFHEGDVGFLSSTTQPTATSSNVGLIKSIKHCFIVIGAVTLRNKLK